MVLDKQACTDQHYEKPEGKLLRIVALPPRCSVEWKAEYKKRPSEERYFSRRQAQSPAGHPPLPECPKDVVARTGVDARLLATALAHLKADDYGHMRHMRIKLPKARDGRPAPVQDVDPGVLAVLLLHECDESRKAAILRLYGARRHVAAQCTGS